MLITSTLNCPYHLALVFDELSSIFQTRNKKFRNVQNLRLNHHFLIWICDLVTLNFEEHFADECSAEWPALQFDTFYALNAVDAESEEQEPDQQPNIAINIAGSCLKTTSKYAPVFHFLLPVLDLIDAELNLFSAIQSITILPSLFNLLRILHYRRYSGSLEAINAVLGAAVALPTVMAPESISNIFDELSTETCKKVLDMHYHTVNFWRECVSAYVSQCEAEMRRKVLTRLSEIIRMELRVRDLLLLAPNDFDYKPPLCHFSSTTNASGKSASKSKKPTGRS